ncbi:MAG: NAD-dependent epimerase/dehydratase family protein [Thermoguttaceae bacterium]|jgi:nucleoside-diphosphate-sugar epimerase
MNETAASSLPDVIRNVEQLEELLSRPSPMAIRALGQVEGDILVLGIAGKMGPTLARMARRASDAAGLPRRLWGVSRFSGADARRGLEAHGVETIQGDLFESRFLNSLPDAANVIYMAGMKFGTTGNESLTWAANTWLPSLVARRFAASRIVAFSTGNVYSTVPIASGGSRESDPLLPCGEYAMSCLGRERMLEHFSRTQGTRTALLRLNYAVEMRYGVLVDLAQKVYDGAEIDLAMGHVNVIWQGDAAAMTLAALPDAASPPWVVNVAGPEILSVRAVCQQFGRLLGKPARFTGCERSDALLNNGEMAHRRYGPPQISVEQMMRWIAHWVAAGGPTLNKPTHFQERDGKF